MNLPDSLKYFLWELHQITDAHSFLCVGAFIRCRVHCVWKRPNKAEGQALGRSLMHSWRTAHTQLTYLCLCSNYLREFNYVSGFPAGKSSLGWIAVFWNMIAGLSWLLAGPSLVFLHIFFSSNSPFPKISAHNPSLTE